MIFKISNTARNALMTKYPVLSKYGFHNEKEGFFGGTEGDIIIDSLDDLMRLTRDLQKEIIIIGASDQAEIEIYDDWRE